MSVTTDDHSNPMVSVWRALVRLVWGDRRDPGYRRLGLGGFYLAFASLETAYLVALVVVRASALDFIFFGTRVASHPGPFVLNDVSLPWQAAVAIVLPISILGLVGGGRLWLGGSPRLALVGSLMWVVLAGWIALAGGGLDLLFWQSVVFALILSGSWARRSPGTRPTDLLRVGAIRAVSLDG